MLCWAYGVEEVCQNRKLKISFMQWGRGKAFCSFCFPQSQDVSCLSCWSPGNNSELKVSLCCAHRNAESESSNSHFLLFETKKNPLYIPFKVCSSNSWLRPFTMTPERSLHLNLTSKSPGKSPSVNPHSSELCGRITQGRCHQSPQKGFFGKWFLRAFLSPKPFWKFCRLVLLQRTFSVSLAVLAQRM